MLETKPAIDIGDLVRLKGDKNLLVGLGIVLDRKEDTKEIAKSMFVKSDLTYSEYMPDLEKDDYLLTSPVFLIWWQSSDDSSFSAKPIWMFYSEISLVSAAKRKRIK
tara:strand:+ start:279 stop:599 length:321 start_codon:yes stop_codon:yes gene_type:complete